MGWEHLLSVPDLAHARQAGRDFALDFDLPRRLRPFEPQRWSRPHVGHPSVQIDDVSAIPFVANVAGVEEYQHRARVRSGDLDTFVTATPAVEGYEDYCREVLAIGAPHHLIAEPTGAPSAVARGCLEGRPLRHLIETAADQNGLTFHPYMGIEEVWELAARVAMDSRTTVEVVAPPPPVTWVANDKALFKELVERVLGPEWLVETRVANDPEGIKADLKILAGRHPRVGLKRTRCASAMGNEVFSSAELLAEPHVLEKSVDEFLSRTEWPKGEDVLSVAWLDTRISPSTQLWIPPLGLGDPKLDGIYEQILEGEEGLFVGSRPSALPDAVNRVLGTTAIHVAAALQELGYVGRCSFDHLVAGDSEDEFRVVFTECNGRWGGTSTPMSLLDRLVDGPRPPYRAQDVVFPSMVGAKLEDLLRSLEHSLFRTATGTGRFVFYNVGPLEKHGKLDVISIGVNQEDAEEGLIEALPKALQL